MATGRATRQLITERFEGGGKPTIDKTANVIRGMKIASWKSLNGRDYTKALKGQAKLYEGAYVSLNHPPKDGVPTVESRFGQYKGVVEQADGIYGDLYFNPEHASAKQILWAAENQPGSLANSHRVEAKAIKSNGVLDVQQITKVRGVEIVTEGGMNTTLFEDYAAGADAGAPSDTASDPVMKACVARVMKTGKSQTEAETICSATPDNKPTSPDTSTSTESLEETVVGDKVLVPDYGGRQVVGTVLKKGAALLVQVGDCVKTVWDDGAVVANGIPTATATEALMANLASMSLDEIKAARPDLAEALLKEAREEDKSDAELKTLREENAKFKLDEEKRTVEAATQSKRDALKKMCETAKVPTALITPLFLESLEKLDDEKVKALIEERKASATGPQPRSRNAPADTIVEANGGKKPLSTKVLSEALNAN